MRALWNKQGIKVGLIALLIPVIQFVALRYYLHSICNLSIGWKWITDFDLILPVPITFLLYSSVLSKAQIPKLAFNKKIFLFNASTFLIFIFAASLMKSKDLLFLSPSFVLLGILFFAIVFSGLCLFISPKFYIKNSRLQVVIACLVMAFSVSISQNYYDAYWAVFCEALSKQVAIVFHLLGFSEVTTRYAPLKLFFVSAPGFSVYIGKGCGGLDAFLFMLVGIGIYFLQKMDNKHPLKWFGIFTLGVIWAYITNLIRIFLLILLGWKLPLFIEARAARTIFFTLAHVHIGWLIYIFSLLIFLWIIENLKLPRLLFKKTWERENVT